MIRGAPSLSPHSPPKFARSEMGTRCSSALQRCERHGFGVSELGYLEEKRGCFEGIDSDDAEIRRYFATYVGRKR